MGTTGTVVSTYRIQFSPYFRFSDAAGLAGYLESLGISHVYASPILEAVPGSVHGYDMTDFSRIREELGGEDSFVQLNGELRKHSIGWIQDFVPNHMAMDLNNPYLADVLSRGRSSEYSEFFDIDWNHWAIGSGKMALPVLGETYSAALSREMFSFVLRESICLEYGDGLYPVSPESLESLLGSDLAREWLSHRGNGRGDPGVPEELKARVESALSEANSSPDRIDRALKLQHYSLRYWKSSANEINYRRFFAVNGLICLREERPEVFATVHGKILELAGSGYFDGIRIDHVDGLFSPAGYLRKLRSEIGGLYLVVEKILEQDESLDENWPVSGTTGYDFLSHVTPVFCSSGNSHGLDAVYSRFTGEEYREETMALESKRSVIASLFPGVMDNLAMLFWRELRRKPYGRDITFRGLLEALEELLVHMPIYRTYIDDGDPSSRGLKLLNSVIQAARSGRADLAPELTALETLINGYQEDETAAAALQTLQQYMPGIYAKSIEDRLFFTYNRLISLNEVGINPFHASNSVESFHNFNMARRSIFPTTMNVLSTHDTKLSEDIRARINVISEMPAEWEAVLAGLGSMNSRHRRKFNGKECPSRNEEYYFYQLLAGSLPLDGGDAGSYAERLKAHLLKSIREAGVNTSWGSPDRAYERQYTRFIDEALKSALPREILRFISTVVFHGCINSLSQKTLQMTCPGVPDIYQGTEIWNYSFVDPDNRREVNFHGISKALAALVSDQRPLDQKFGEYMKSYTDGRVKLFLTSRLLDLRKRFPDLFLSGTYSPVEASGRFHENLIAFSRKYGNTSLLVAVPRLTVELSRDRYPVGKEVWDGTSLNIPEELRRPMVNVLTGETLDLSGSETAEAGMVLNLSPVAVLLSR